MGIYQIYRKEEKNYEIRNYRGRQDCPGSFNFYK